MVEQGYPGGVRTAMGLAAFAAPSSEEDQAGPWRVMFEARRRRNEIIQAAKAKAKEEIDLKGYRQMVRRETNIEPLTETVLTRYHDAFARDPVRAAKSWAELMIYGHALGFDKDVDLPPPSNVDQPDDSVSVFDRTRTGQSMKGFQPRQYQRTASPPRRMQETEALKLETAQKMFEEALAGRPMRVRVGRPSNVEREAMTIAERWLEERDMREAAQADKDANPQHEGEEHLTPTEAMRKLMDAMPKGEDLAAVYDPAVGTATIFSQAASEKKDQGE